MERHCDVLFWILMPTPSVLHKFCVWYKFKSNWYAQKHTWCSAFKLLKFKRGVEFLFKSSDFTRGIIIYNWEILGSLQSSSFISTPTLDQLIIISEKNSSGRRSVFFFSEWFSTTSSFLLLSSSLLGSSESVVYKKT